MGKQGVKSQRSAGTQLKDNLALIEGCFLLLLSVKNVPAWSFVKFFLLVGGLQWLWKKEG